MARRTQNQYPFVGLLAFYDGEGAYSHRCTGTLISPIVVLTAAHCTEGTATAYAYFSVEVPDDFRENPTGALGYDVHPPGLLEQPSR
jgi:secreted trypsin-like serine protease